jgi:hypothetical protein
MHTHSSVAVLTPFQDAADSNGEYDSRRNFCRRIRNTQEEPQMTAFAAQRVTRPVVETPARRRRSADARPFATAQAARARAVLARDPYVRIVLARD